MDALWQALRVLVMALMIPLLLRTRKDLRTLMLVIGVSLGLLGSKFGLFGIWHGGVRFALGYGGMLSDNNSLALGLAMGMPFMWFGRDLVSRLWLKAALLAMFAFSSAAVVMTYSRGGAVAMAVGLLAIVWRSRHKLLVLVGLVIISIPTLVFVGSKYLDRLSTLKAPTEEASAYSRVVLAKAGLQLWMDYPILGVGFGQQNEQVLINRYLDEGYKGHGMKVLHNTYVQLLSDCGVFAFILFCGLLFGTLIWLNGVIKRARDQQDMIGPCASALQSSLVAYAVGATTLSRAEWDLIYIELAVAALILRILKEDLEEASSPIPAPEMISEGFSYPAPAPRQNWK